VAHNVYHVHYTGWPDSGVPPSTLALFQLIELTNALATRVAELNVAAAAVVAAACVDMALCDVTSDTDSMPLDHRALSSSSSSISSMSASSTSTNARAARPPVVVHCSAGVGRAGTFIAAALLIEKVAIASTPVSTSGGGGTAAARAHTLSDGDADTDSASSDAERATRAPAPAAAAAAAAAHVAAVDGDDDDALREARQHVARFVAQLFASSGSHDARFALDTPPLLGTSDTFYVDDEEFVVMSTSSSTYSRSSTPLVCISPIDALVTTTATTSLLTSPSPPTLGFFAQSALGLSHAATSSLVTTSSSTSGSASTTSDNTRLVPPVLAPASASSQVLRPATWHVDNALASSVFQAVLSMRKQRCACACVVWSHSTRARV
jgi:hypothetical protein